MKEAFMSAGFSELRLTECGREQCTPLKNIISDPKPWYTVHYILYGKGTFVLGNKSYPMGKGEIFYIPPGLSSQYYPDKQEPWIYVWLGFDGEYAQKIIEKSGLSEANPIFNKDKNFTLKNYFNELADRYNVYAELNMDCMSAALKIFWEMTNFNNGKPSAPDLKAGHVHEAKQFISNNYQFPITVQDVADSLGLTPNYLANIFKEQINTTPKQYLIQYRITRACYLLTGANMSIKDVAQMVGYKNQLHFSAEFKRIKKMSPLEYKAKNKLSKPEQQINDGKEF